MKKRLFAALTFLFASIAFAKTIGCEVTSIGDGDTITCLTAQHNQIKVKLWGTDAPELRQDFGEESKRALSDMVEGKKVLIEVNQTDEYQLSGTIYISGCWQEGADCSRRIVIPENINLTMLQKGMAWHNPFSKQNPEYQQAEQEAKTAKRGLWINPNPVPPWQWQKQQKEQSDKNTY